MNDYRCICPVCGVRFTHSRRVLLCARTRVDHDGSTLCVISCGEHPAEAVRAAWEGRHREDYADTAA